MSRHALNTPSCHTGQSNGLLVQRTCACGTHSGKPKCSDCERKPALQRSDRSQTQPAEQLVQSGSAGEPGYPQDFSGLATHSPRAAGPAELAATDPVAILDQLGAGQALDSGVRSRMESVYGGSLAGVRTHVDATASDLANEQNARAFTVGEHIAFGAGEYRPGTIVGDALIAHELAHVVQQGTASRAAPGNDSAGGHHAMERDADDAAAEAVTALWSGTAARSVAPGSRSGLRLSRCDRSQHNTPQALPQKTVTINITVLAGATDNSAADLQRSNRIFSGCNLRVAAGTPQTLDPAQTAAILRTDNLLEEPAGATASTEEQQLVTNNRASDRITAYYVPGFNPAKRGTSLQAPRHGVPDSLLMSQAAAVDTFTHELGHILARDHQHNSDPDNLMADGSNRNVGVDNVTSAQCIDFRTKTSYPQ